MKEYIKETVRGLDKATGQKIKMVVSPAKDDLFTRNTYSPPLPEKMCKVFHITVARLVFLGNRSRRYAKIAINFKRTRV